MNFVDFSKLGGIYFIEGDSKKESEEYYKIGMSGYNLIKRIDSIYPFGINIRGLFTIKRY